MVMTVMGFKDKDLDFYLHLLLDCKFLNPISDTNNLLSGFQSLVGMGVATVRLVAAVLTVLGVWIHLDTLRNVTSQILTDTSEDSNLVDRRFCAKVSTRISTASERRV